MLYWNDRTASIAATLALCVAYTALETARCLWPHLDGQQVGEAVSSLVVWLASLLA
jgi:hypothetical protein